MNIRTWEKVWGHFVDGWRMAGLKRMQEGIEDADSGPRGTEGADHDTVTIY